MTDKPCAWIQSSLDYKAWRKCDNEEKRILCLTGPSGCGKTFAAHHIMKDLENCKNDLVLDCFLGDGMTQKTDMRTVIELLLHRLLQKERKSIEDILGVLSTGKDKWQLDALSRDLKRVLQNWDLRKALQKCADYRIWIVFDAYKDDEPGFFNKLLDLVYELSKLSRTSILFTCPKVGHKYAQSNLPVSIDVALHNSEELDDFISLNLSNQNIKSEPIQSNLLGEIRTKSCGSFYWAELAMRYLQCEISIGEKTRVLATLLSLEKDTHVRNVLWKSLERTLELIPTRKPSMVLALQFVLMAKQAPTKASVKSYVATTQVLLKKSFNLTMQSIEEAEIVNDVFWSDLQPFLQITHDNRVLVYPSMLEAFKREPTAGMKKLQLSNKDHSTPNEVSHRIARACLSYLLAVFATPNAQASANDFFAYAQTHWIQCFARSSRMAWHFLHIKCASNVCMHPTFDRYIN